MFIAEEELLKSNQATAEELAAWRNETKQEIELITARVLREPPPDPYEEDWAALSTKHLGD